MNVIDIFAGVGGWTEGARQAGHKVIASIESDHVAARYYARNHGGHVHEVDILNVEPQALPDCDILLASPPCPNFSVAKAGGSETELDIALARKIAGFIATKRPRYFFLENVYQYRRSQSWELIQDNLNLLGYWTQVHHLNSADFGVPQTRKRMIVRAVRDGHLPPLPPKQKWVGWYSAIEDILHTLPESEFAPWQLSKLPNDPSDWKAFLTNATDSGPEARTKPRGKLEPAMTVTTSRLFKAFLVAPSHGTAKDNGDRNLAIRELASPAMTITAKAKPAEYRAWLEHGRVVQMNVHALARFQSFPDTTVWPEGKSDATRLIGNAVPPKLAAALLEGLG